MVDMPRLLLVSTVSFSLAVTGCISWQTGDARSVPDPLFVENDALWGASDKVSVGFAATYEIVGQPYLDLRGRERIFENITDVAQRAFSQSDHLVLATSSEDWDYLLYVDVRERGDADLAVLLGVVSGVTLAVLPAWETHDYTVTARLRTRYGRRLGEHVVRQKRTTLIQLFTVVAMPFADPGTVEKRMWNGVFRDVALWTNDTIKHHRSTDARPAP